MTKKSGSVSAWTFLGGVESNTNRKNGKEGQKNTRVVIAIAIALSWGWLSTDQRFRCDTVHRY